MQCTNCHIETDRLTLSPLCAAHMKRFIAIAGDWDVARMTADIPHPLSPSAAQLWFRGDPYERRYAIEHAGTMIGTVGYFVCQSGSKDNDCGARVAKEAALTANEGGELGFFIAKDHWSAGFASEAARAVIAHGFAAGLEGGPLTRFTSSHFTDNPASARVLAKLGFRPTFMRQVNCAARGQPMQAQCYSLNRVDFDLSAPKSGAQDPAQPSDTGHAANQHMRDAL